MLSFIQEDVLFRGQLFFLLQDFPFIIPPNTLDKKGLED